MQKLEFEKSLDLRTFEIDNFWKRGWFFGILLLAIASGYFELHKDPNNNRYCIYMAFLGLLISFFQGLMNRGSKYWQERWENKTKHLESILKINVTKSDAHNEKYYLDAGTLAKNENIFTRGKRYSVSKLTFLVWDIITLSWLFLWIGECHFIFYKDSGFHFSSFKELRDLTFFIHLMVFLYIFIFFFLRRSDRMERIYKKLRRLISNSIKIFSFSYGGGGKVYENFAIKDDKSHDKNTRTTFYKDSMDYTNNFPKKP